MNPISSMVNRLTHPPLIRKRDKDENGYILPKETPRILKALEREERIYPKLSAGSQIPSLGLMSAGAVANDLKTFLVGLTLHIAGIASGAVLLSRSEAIHEQLKNSEGFQLKSDLLTVKLPNSPLLVKDVYQYIKSKDGIPTPEELKAIASDSKLRGELGSAFTAIEFASRQADRGKKLKF
jgi:hypothetical protein